MELQREDGETETVAVTLGEFAVTVGLEQQRQVGKLRHRVFPSEGTIKEHVERGRRQPLLTADDVADLHQMVIYDVCQVIGGQVVCRLIEHLIIQDITVDHHFAADKVMHVHVLVRLYFESNDIFLAFVQQGFYLVCTHGQRVTHHLTRAGVVLEVRYLRALGLQLLRGVESDIRMSGIQQLLHIPVVDLAPLGLTVRTVLSYGFNLLSDFLQAQTFVNADAQPIEGLQDILLSARHKTRRVGILNTQEHVSAVLTGKQVIVQSGTYTADV